MGQQERAQASQKQYAALAEKEYIADPAEYEGKEYELAVGCSRSVQRQRKKNEGRTGRNFCQSPCGAEISTLGDDKPGDGEQAADGEGNCDPRHQMKFAAKFSS